MRDAQTFTGTCFADISTVPVVLCDLYNPDTLAILHITFYPEMKFVPGISVLLCFSLHLSQASVELNPGAG